MRWRTATAWILVLLGGVGAVVAFLSIARAGIGWDAPVDARALLEVRALPTDIDLDSAYEAVQSTSEFYGILIPQLSEWAHSVITGSSAPLDPWNLETYRWQAGITVCLAIAGAAALGFATSQALRSPVAGAFAWAAIMSTPVYVGMSHVNFKDMPVAAGISMASAGLMVAWAGRRLWLQWVASPALLAAGFIVTLGTRPGAWPLLGGLVLTSSAAYGVACIRRRTFTPLWATVTGTVLATVATWMVLVATNPFARIDLPRWMFDAFTVMRQYPWDGVTRAGGQDFPATELPWWYVPGWLLAQMPVLTTIALVWAAIAIIGALARSRWSVERSTLIGMTPVAVQGLVIPVGIVLTGSVLYDGLRHILFMVPALGALAAMGIAALDCGHWSRPKLPQVAAAATSLLVVLMGLFATLRWMPYSYAFTNPVASKISGDHAWELDYWGVTAIEGARLLQEQGLPAVAVEPTLTTSDIVGVIWRDQARDQAPDGYGYYVFKRGDASIGTCESLFTIERDGQILGEGARCTKSDG